MISILNFCQHDRDQALRMLTWIGELGGAQKHDLVLQFNPIVKNAGSFVELEEEAKKHFASVSTVVPDTEDERGWPFSPNHGWMNALQLVREKIQKPWLWLEPDCVPLKPDWLDQLEAEYARAGKPFMGAEVTSPGHRMSGIGVYPPKVVAFLQKRHLSDLIRKEAFDSFFAEEIIQHAHFTPLIQNVWMATRNPDTMPSFSTPESLALIDPRAVLFHRCKDFTLIDRLSEKLKLTQAVERITSHQNQLNPEGRAMVEEIKDTHSNGAEEQLRQQLEVMRAELAALRKPRRQGQRMKQKPNRTAAEQAKIDARMAKVRAGRKKAVTA